jgi:hypothetical protein
MAHQGKCFSKLPNPRDLSHSKFQLCNNKTCVVKKVLLNRIWQGQA